MALLQYFITFCLAFARPELGLIILTFAVASVGTVWTSTSISGIGSLQLSDFAILGITTNLLFNAHSWGKRHYSIWLAIILWLLALATLHAITRPDGVKIAYNLIVRYGLFWLIPIVIAELPTNKRYTLIGGMIVCGLFVTGIQIYTYIERDPSFTVQMYYHFHNRRFFLTPIRDVSALFASTRLPRFYPSGAVLVQALFVFSLANVLLPRQKVGQVLPKAHKCSKPFWAALFCIYGVFFISLRQRSSVLSLIIVLCFITIWNAASQSRLRLATRAFSIVALGIAAALVFQAATGAPFFKDFGQRFQNDIVDLNRVQDDWIAFEAIVTSPLTGTASRDVQELARERGSSSWGLDVHPFLTVALLGGVPLLLLVGGATWCCLRRCRTIAIMRRTDNVFIASVVSVVYVVCVATLNFSQALVIDRDMLPLLLFVGLMLRGDEDVCRTEPPTIRRYVPRSLIGVAVKTPLGYNRVIVPE